MNRLDEEHQLRMKKMNEEHQLRMKKMDEEHQLRMNRLDEKDNAQMNFFTGLAMRNIAISDLPEDTKHVQFTGLRTNRSGTSPQRIN